MTQKVLRQTKAAVVGSFQEAKVGSAGDSKEKAKEVQVSLESIGVKPNLKPTGHLSPEERTVGQVGANNDHLANIQNGAQTLLNTKEFAYFSFYQRVRKQLEQFWEPGLKIKIRKMINRGRSIAEDKEHATTLFVILNTLGIITKIQIKDTSGVSDLDQAAIDAFNRAGPFPNPPKGLVEADGTIRIEWEFVLKT